MIHERVPLRLFRAFVAFLGVAGAAVGQGSAIFPDGDFVAPSSDPNPLLVVGDTMYFVANDGSHGREVWVLKDGGVRMLRDFAPGPESSQILAIEPLGSRAVFFRGQESLVELWITDGTDSGTEMISPAGDRRFTAFHQLVGRLGDSVLFSANQHGRVGALWISDGSREGTRSLSLRDTESGGVSVAAPTSAALGDDKLVFWGAGRDSRHGLWITDGTESGTREVMSMVAAPHGFFSSRDSVTFVVNSARDVMELWTTRGTKESTRKLMDLDSGVSYGFPIAMERWGDQTILSLSTASHGAEPWISDGTAEGTRMIKDIFSGPGGSDPYKFKAGSSQMFFIAKTAGAGAELWVTRGTEESTRMLRDLYPGAHSSEPYAFCTIGDTLYFSCHHPEYGEELWKSDGTPEGTVLVEDMVPGKGSSEPYGKANYQGELVFTATHPVYGRELFAYDGQSVRLFADLNTDGAMNPSSYPEKFTATDNLLYFVADDFASGTELWATDGTEEGTRLVLDINPGRASSDPRDLTPMGARLFFCADDGTNGVELWVTEGTAESTRLVKDICQDPSAAPRELTVLGDALIFVAQTNAWGYELWTLVGQVPTLLHDINPGPDSSDPAGLVEWNGRVYFRARDTRHGEELWVTDGTTEGTRMLRDIVVVPGSGATTTVAAPFKGALYFGHDDGVRGSELWRMDADGAGIMLRDIAASYARR